MTGKQRFTIPGQLIGLNEYTAENRRNKYAGAHVKSQCQHVVAMAIRQAKLRPVRGKVILHYLWIEPARRRDKDNIAFAQKFIQDALVQCGIIVNDGWDYVEGFTHAFAVDKKKPRVEIEIEEAGVIPAREA